ncbi:PREDICTED: eukaryotic translation initiation factor 4E type 1B [Chrysochloris asiatica]|uniref:Eukaryotic translation initiation factor 4E type 1B n=1 Tax=Chrysochloris asiatica TaxID=185453 RepID=A0A9B0X081_CHRAS|nr:PREDICTED: eukaryotic translation initiation factor 4E type 1B [Chrysochloris asiatica]
MWVKQMLSISIYVVMDLSGVEERKELVFYTYGNLKVANSRLNVSTPSECQGHAGRNSICLLTAMPPALGLPAEGCGDGSERLKPCSWSPPPPPPPKAKESEGGIPKWEKEEEEAAERVLVEEETGAPNSTSTASLPLRRKARAWDEDHVETAEVGQELHPLQNRWALWFFKNDSSRVWQDNLHLITKFDTVEDFWSTYSHIQQASKLSSGCDYALFKDGIQPMWEDSRNKRGGRWLVSLAKHQRHSKLDRLWLETMLCLIGESFEEHSREVCGAVVNIRTKGDKISVWTQEAENQASVLHIGQVYKEHLGLSTKATIGYQAHADTATKSTRNKFVV